MDKNHIAINVCNKLTLKMDTITALPKIAQLFTTKAATMELMIMRKDGS